MASPIAPTLQASADILPFRFVKMTGAKTCATAGANERIIGVSGPGTRYAPLSDLVTTNNHANTGEPVQVRGDTDICLVTAGASFSAGVALKSDATGRAVAIATSGAATQNVGAIALEAATAANELIQVQIQIGSEEAPA